MILHFLLLSLPPFGFGAHATSFYIRPMPEFTQDAANIVRGRLHQPHAEFGISSSGERNIYTFAELEVLEVLKGDIAKSTLVIRKLGGTKEGVTLHIPGSPEFRDGEEAVYFLGTEKEDHSFEVNGLELGKFGLEEKNGELALTGGLLSFSSGPESREAIGPGISANQRTWTLKQLKSLIESQKKTPQEKRPGPSDPAPLSNLPPPRLPESSIKSESSSSGGDTLRAAEPDTGRFRVKAAGFVFILAGALLGIFLYLRRK